jgi:hypothetical protein
MWSRSCAAEAVELGLHRTSNSPTIFYDVLAFIVTDPIHLVILITFPIMAL